MIDNQELTVIGIMSGTSLDGLDICCAKFNHTDQGFHYQFIVSKTYSYSDSWNDKLATAIQMNETELSELDKDLGTFIAKLTEIFIAEHGLKGKVDLVGSHGHTVFHQPAKGITVQIGAGEEIANQLNLPVINDFRIKDVQLGGEGAPLVPIGDKFLFPTYQSCLNLGGIANISFDKNGERLAFDISPANLPLNKLIQDSFDSKFDRDGEIALTGTIIPGLLKELNQLSYYTDLPPKSLGIEWLNDNFYPLVDEHKDEATAHLLRTVVEHETEQISVILNDNNLESCLVTGGGALNSFFMEQLSEKTSCQLIIPELELVEFKEALIFAFLAYLNRNNQINTLSSVTGAREDSIGGILHLPTS